MKRRILSALCCILMLGMLALTGFAAENVDFSRTGSISIAMTYRGKPVGGGSLTLYRVAEVAVEREADYSFRLLDAYAESGVNMENLSDPQLALALAEYTDDQDLEGSEKSIDKKGKISFTDLPLGLYLLVQEDAAPGYAKVNPFLVSVPANAGGSYIYDVDASPKLGQELEPTEPTPPTDPTEPTLPPNLPQTGLNQWPVPAMAVGGVLLFLLGLVFYRAGKRDRYEG